jgi:hypothetical protein
MSEMTIERMRLVYPTALAVQTPRTVWLLTAVETRLVAVRATKKLEAAAMCRRPRGEVDCGRLARATFDLRAAGRDLEQARGVLAVVDHPAQLGSGRKHGDGDTGDNSGDGEEHDVYGAFWRGLSCVPLELRGINAGAR